MNLQKKAQGALEYLLLIAGAVLIAAVVIIIALNMTGAGNEMGQEQMESFGSQHEAIFIVPTNGLVGYWKFEDNLDDSSGNGNNGIWVGAPSYASGKSGHGRAASMAGEVDHYIEIHGGLDWQPTAFTVSWWLYPKTNINYNQQLRAVVGGWGGFSFHTGQADEGWCGTDVAKRFDSGDLPAGTVELEEWQHFAYTFDGTSGRFYKNGELLAGPKAQDLPAGWGGLRIGTNTASTINGLVDTVVVYDRALSPAEVGKLYNILG